jgi:DNA-binding GntR family transcriptional regulator
MTEREEELSEPGTDRERIGKGMPPPATLAAKVYEQVRDDIILGRLAPDRKLTLDLLTERYGVGMTPLREALYRLSASRLVTLEDRRGFRVASVSPTHLAEVIELREAVETMLLRDAFKHADVHWEAQIVAAYHCLQRTAEYRFNPGPYTSDWESAHRGFHFALLAAARLPMLREFHLSVWDHVARYRNLAYAGKAMSPSVFEGHQQLMEAALARDEELASVLLRRHITFGTSHIMDGLFPETVPGQPSAAPPDRTTRVARAADSQSRIAVPLGGVPLLRLSDGASGAG